MGLMVLLVIFLYCALLVGVTVAGFRFGSTRGWSVGRRGIAAFIAFLAIVLPVFWDWLPTVWLHSYYCSEYGGLTIDEKYVAPSVYKTLERWVAANPGVVETLVREKPLRKVGSGDKHYYQLNQRFRWEIDRTEKLLSLRQDQETIVDAKTGEAIVRFVDFWTGQRGGSPREFRDFKVWMNRRSCEAEGHSVNRRKFIELRTGFEYLGG